MSVLARIKKKRFVAVLGVLCAFLGTASPVLAQSLTFGSTNLVTGNGPINVAAVDINGDGHPGLVTANFGFRYGGGPGTGDGNGTTLSVFTNDGYGDLSSNATLNVGLEPAYVAVADVNGDGAQDLICANVGDNTLTVLTNNGHGGFALEGTFAVGLAPTFVAAADVNGDGYVDLISANFGDSTLTVLTNNGHGSFKFSATITVGAQPGAFVTADINGDGSIDLVCTIDSGTALLTLTNNGRGVFTPTATNNVATGAGWVIGTDVNGDGSVDLVTAGGGTSLSVLTNDGHGNFSLKSTLSTLANSGTVQAADMNGDGKADLVCVINNNGIQGFAEVLTNDGTGNFSSNAVVAVGTTDWGSVGGNYPSSLAVADFNGDGNNDMAVSCYGTALLTEMTQINVTPRPIVTITSPTNDALIPTNESFEISMTASSPNKIEVLIYFIGTNYFGSTNAPFSVQIPAGKFPAGTYALQAEAVDSAGRIGWSPEVQINITAPPTHIVPSPPLTFSSTTLAVGNGPVYVLPVDLNGNGNVDLVTANLGYYPYFLGCVGTYGGQGSNLTVWLNNGHGVFSSRSSVTVGFNDPSIGITSEPTCVTAADFLNNGDLQLINTIYYENFLSLLTNNGHGVFSEASQFPAGARGPIYVTNGDFRGTGLQDLVCVNNYDTNLTVLTNTGNGSFSNSATLPVPDKPVWVAVADVNGDGALDLISANYGDCGDGNTLTVFTNDGHGNFASNATLTVGIGPLCVVAADVNGDGFVDLISANQVDYTMTVLTNDGLGNFTLQSKFTAVAPSAVVAVDLSGDGKIDLAVANSTYYTRGSVTIFLNDGQGNFTSNTTVEVGNESSTNDPNSIAAADFNGDGKMDLVVANYGSASLTVLTQTTSQKPPPPPPPPPPAPTISITYPTNGEFFPTNDSFVITTTAQPANDISVVDFYLDGELLGTSTAAPFELQVSAGSIPPGGHELEAVAVNTAGVSATSVVVQITLNTPGTALIDFDVLNTSAGAVGGTALAKYLAEYGVTLANVTVGTAMEAVNTNSFTGSIQVEAPSAPNIFTQAGLDQPVSFTLRFATNLQAFGFTRAGLASSSGLVSHPQWTATAFNANGTELSSVTEGLILSSNPVRERSFVLTGNGIASVSFSSDGQQTAAFSAVLLDNLLLNYNSVAPVLSVALSVASPPTNRLVAPATITLSANVTDQVSSSYNVSFFAGAALLGTASGNPAQLTLNNVLSGNYSLQARVVDASGLTALSTVVPITVQLEPDSTLVDFDTLNTSQAPVETTAVEKYLAAFGVTVTNLSPGTELTVDRQQHIAGGMAVLAASPPNLLTQTGSNGPVRFTLRFAPLLSQFGFTRPELLANPFVSHPAWQVTAFDGSGAVVDQVAEGQIGSSTNVGAQEFSLGQTGGPGIAAVEFASEGSGLTTFNGMLVDNLVLTTNTSGFPPAVAITAPVSGLVLAKPPAVTVTAAAFDAAGIASVSFYASGALLGTDTHSPYTVQWAPPRARSYALTAVASNVLGLAWTSSVVNVVIQPSAYQFAIASSPVSQTVALDGSATFGVVTTGTNVVTYQWYYNGGQIPGATAATLVLNPPIADSNAGTYTVAVTAQGETLVSAPAVLTVVDPPTILSQPAGTNVPAGSTVGLIVAAAGRGFDFTYQWLLNGNSIPGATDGYYFIQAAQPRQSGNYQVVVANSQVVVANLAASTLSAVAPVIVETAITIAETNTNFVSRASINPLLGPVADSNQLATLQKGAPLPDGLPGGNTIWFTWRPAFTGTVSLTTQGSDFDTVMAVYTGTALSNLKVVAADDDSGGYLTSLVTFNVTSNTEYQIAVDGFQGASGRVVLGLPPGTGYRILNPSSGDSAPVIVKGPVSQTVAPGAKVVLSVQAASATPATCQWNFQSAPITGATGSTLVISHLQPGSVGLYDVLVANAVGSVQSAPANVQIALNQGPKAISTGSKFLNSTNPASPRGLATVLRPFDLGGDTGGFSVAQVFSTVGATSEPGEPQPCGQVGSASEWFVYTAPSAGLMQVNTDGSTFNTILGVYTGPGTSFSSLVEEGCGYSTNYSTEGQPSVVLPNVAKGTTFYILVEGYQGASGVAQLQIGLGKTLAFAALPSSQLVTAGSNATFEATAVGSTPFSYQWQLNGANVPGATKSTYTVAGAQDKAVGNYTVIVSNVLGAVTGSPPAALTLQYAPAIVAGPSNLTVTLGRSAKFTVETLGVNVKTNPFVCQWYFNGAPLPKANSLSLSIPATHWTNNGAYNLVISNTYGSATSGPATLTVVDKTRPTVVIKTPAANAVTNVSRVTVTGTAADIVGVAQVLVEVNTNGFVTANGTTNWTNIVRLPPGTNVISAYSVDLPGNLSAVVKRTIIYKPPTPSPGPETVPNPVAHSLPDLAGTYSGLFYPVPGATRASSGFFTATVSSRTAGVFSANILLDGGSYPFAGRFDPSGNAKAIVPRAGKLPVTASLQLDLDPSRGQMTGVISNADWRSILQAGRCDFNAATNPAPVCDGQYAIIVPSDAAAPAGYLTINNTPGGTALVAGTLADGATFLRAAPMAKGPAIPLYVPLYSGQGLFLGWITLTNSTAQANFGQAVWIRPGATNPAAVFIVK